MSRGRLARAIRTQKTDDLAGGKIEGNAVHSRNFPLSAVQETPERRPRAAFALADDVGLAKVMEVDGRLGPHLPNIPSGEKRHKPWRLGAAPVLWNLSRLHTTAETATSEAPALSGRAVAAWIRRMAGTRLGRRARHSGSVAGRLRQSQPYSGAM